jgi:predicted nicotinamide N-methyase
MDLLRNPPRPQSPTAEIVLTYSIPDLGDVYLMEQPSLLVGNGTTGFRTWEASFVLAEWILAQGDMEGKRVLELGAGTGLVGIIAAKLGAKVTMTDGSEAVIERLPHNAGCNNEVVEAKVLWWGEDDELLNRDCDFIIGADITYDDEVCVSLAETYARVVKRGGTGVLAATVRNERTLQTFRTECGKPLQSNILTIDTQGLHLQELEQLQPKERVFFSGSPFPVKLFRIAPQ